MNTLLRLAFTFLAPLLLFLIPGTAHAYGGPGSVVSGIGAFLAAIAALLAAIFGFTWFPLKRLFRKMHGSEESNDDTAVNNQPGR